MKSAKAIKPVKKTPAKKRKKRISKKLIYKNKLTAIIIAGSLTALSLILSMIILSLQNRSEQLSVQQTPSQQTPAQQTPAQQTSAQQTPAQQTPAQQTPAQQTPAQQTPVQQTPVQQTPAAQQAPPVRVIPQPSQGKLVFVIDDAGNNLRELEPFLRFPGPLTIAVLPGLPNSAEASRRIRAAGKEVFLHQPMESLAGHNPGPGAIFSGMDEIEIRTIINRNLDELWPVAGMNNHEGSRVTMDQGIMEIILDICRQRGIIYLDSRTTAQTAAPAAAQRLGIQIGERDVFLDNERDRASISNSLNQGLARARQNNKAVMIGHASTRELASLMAELYPVLLEQGFGFSSVSGLLNGN